MPKDLCFVDYTKAFDNIRDEDLSKLLERLIYMGKLLE